MNARRAGAATVMSVVSLLVAACAAEDPRADQPPATASGPSTSQAAPDPMQEPTVDGRYPVADGQQMAVQCYGTGAPTVVYDAGSDSSGIAAMTRSSAMKELASSTTVCSFDRLGLGDSDAPPQQRRSLDDLVDDIHAGLTAAGVAVPFVMVGSSWGGFDVFEYAGVHGKEVAGLVMLDVPKGQAKVTGVPAWDDPENAEHVDITAAERQMALHRKAIPAIPVTVITATSGQSADPAEQLVWSKGSSDPRQVMVETGHDVLGEDPATVVAEVTRLLGLA